nr:tRNA 2-thiouridine(34) synthase MnmA [uncultured Sellimonas sp.]
MKKAMIAMSGGVDSSAAAFLMKEQGYECTGINMRLYQNEDAGLDCRNTCCSLDDVEDARRVAYGLGIPFYVFNFKEEFKKEVIGRFVTAYENGITPNPCIDCNRYIKFEKLYQRAMQLGFDCLVTGHYARIEKKEDRYLLKKAVDETKDQSYVLYSMTQEQLSRTRFPLGEFCKTETRKLAESHELINADKPDSQDICFVPDGDYAKVIEIQTHKTYPPGDFVDMQGNVLGRHKGIIRYTIGQRKGLGVTSPDPLYVCKICPETNTIVLGKNEDLYTRTLTASQMNWIAWDIPPQTFRTKAKIRYKQKEQWATIQVLDLDHISLVFDEPQRAITKGQAVVLYDKDIVLGGGIIS